MEYKDLHDKEQEKLARNEKIQSNASKRLAENREIYARHLKRAEAKGYEFALYEAYLEDEDDDETSSEPQIAQGIWDDENLGFIKQLIEKKADEITINEKQERDLIRAVNRRRGLVKAIANFNPCREQANRAVVQKDFFFAPDGKWLDEHKRRRREQGTRTNSIFKTFQDIFTRHQYRIIPKAEGKFGTTDFDALPLDPVIVDPERMTDTFLGEFSSGKFGHEGEFRIFVPPKGIHELDRLRAKRGMIPAIKHFFYEHVKPTPRSSWDDADLNYRVLVVEGFDPSCDGKIIMPHFDSSKHPDIRRKIINVHSGAYSARRQVARLFKGYEKESKRLTATRWYLWQVRKYLSGDKKNDPVTIEKSRLYLIKALETLGGQTDEPKDQQGKQSNPRRPDNVYKGSAFDRLITTTELKDIRQRLNVGASLAKLVSVCNDLESRLEEVDDTSIAGPQDQNTINAIINQSEIVLGSYKEALQSYIENGNIQPFEALKDSLPKIKVRPFSLYAQQLIKCFHAINGSNGDRNLKMSEVKKAYAVACLFCAQKEVEHLLIECDLNPANGTKLLENVLNKVKELKVIGYEAQFDGLERMLADLQKLIAEDADCAGNHALLRTALKEIDFEEILNSIK